MGRQVKWIGPDVVHRGFISAKPYNTGGEWLGLPWWSVNRRLSPPWLLKTRLWLSQGW